MRNQQNVKVRVNSNFETICPFPVGYVYMSSNSTSPADIYGGTWSAISGGRYMRAAAAWGNGGSNTITINQMPSHTHKQPRFYVYDKGGWSSPINGNAVPQVASNVTSTPFATPTSLDNVKSTGGGQHSTQLTKTFGCGTELPKEGDAECVTYKLCKSVHRLALKRFVRSLSDIFTCLQIRLVQLVHTVEHGLHLLIQDSSDHQALGIQSVVANNSLPHTHIKRLLNRTLTYMEQLLIVVFGTITKLRLIMTVWHGGTKVKSKKLVLEFTEWMIKILRSLHIEPAMLGIAQLNLAGEC